MNKNQTWKAVLLAIVTVGIPLMSFAATLPGIPPNTDANAFIKTVLCGIAAYIFDALLIVSIIIVLVAAYMYVIHGNEPEEITRAHFWLLYAAIGIVVALVAKAFPVIVASVISPAQGTALQALTCQ